MTSPAVYGGLGITTHGLGRLGLGGPQPPQSHALPSMPTTALTYIAHLYDHNMVFKRTLGAAAVLNHPGLKLTQNAGFQQITLELAGPVAGAGAVYGLSIYGASTYLSGGAVILGDVIRLTEQGDNAGTILFSGNVETTPEDLSPLAAHYQITITPWVAELGDAYFNHTYSIATDVAQFVRDAVAGTAHCSVSPISCPNSGVMAIYDFQDTNALDAVHVAKQIAGANWWWFVDEQGLVWFQPVVTDSAHPATLTIRRGVDYNSKKASASIAGMKNMIPVIGGANPGDPGRISSLYNGVANQALYGVRAFNPTPSFPNVTDQATLDAIAASLGAQFDRVLNTVELNCPALGKRLSPGRPGGLTVRFWEPNKESLQQAGVGSGVYSPTLILQDIESDGPQQRLVIGDIPYTDTDTAYEATRIAQRISTIAATATATPALTPPPTPPPSGSTVTSVAAKATVGPHLYAMGAGTFTICTANFTTAAAGTVSLVAALDCRMEGWDNYVAAPRRRVWAEIVTLAGGKGSDNDLPFGLTRVTVTDGDVVNAVALAPGTYTVRWRAITTEFNQLRVYSGYAQAVTTI